MALILLIFILALSFAVLFDEKILDMVPFSVFLIIITIYISGMFFTFLPGIYMIIAFTVVLFLYLFIKKRITLKTLKSDKIWYFGAAEYFVILLALLLFTYNLQLASWDEFSHWGLVVKWFYYINDFATAGNSSVYFLSYPPGISIFAYFAEKLSGGFREGIIYFAYDVFIMSLLFPIFRIVDSRWTGFRNIVIGATCPFIPMLFFSSGLNSCYSEIILGVLIGYILLTYLTMHDSRLKWVNIGMAVFILSIVKEAGLGLSIILLLIILICEISIYRRFSHAAFCTAFAIAGKVSWNIRLSIEGISKNSYTMGHIFETICKQNGLLEYQKKTIINFGKQFYGGDIGSLKLYSSLAWLIFAIATVILISKMIEKEKNGKQFIIALWGMIVGFPVYSVSLLSVYLTNLSESEAVSTASFERYIMIYILGASIVLIYVWIQFCNLRHVLGIIVGIVWIQTVLGVTLSQWMDIDDIYRTSNYSYLDGSPLQDIPMDEKICFVHYSDSKDDIPLLSNLIFKTYYTPHKTFDYILKWHDDSGEVCMETTPNEWIDALINNECRYVYLDDIDDGFVDIYGEMFDDIEDIDDRTLFRLNEDQDKLIFISAV